jgi:DNA mismatch endonuclease, patch repair protein
LSIRTWHLCWLRMADIVDQATRSRMMSGIRSKDTRIEVAIRQGLHKLGFRYRLHSRYLPGRPDLTFARFRAVIFVHGCFWHGHDCKFFRLPGTRTEFWRTKIGRNRERDESVKSQLAEMGWRHLVIWECAIRGRGRSPIPSVLENAAFWLRSGARSSELRGQ